MPQFKIAVQWMMCGQYNNVEADTLEAAKEKVLDCEFPYDKLPKGIYVGDSMEINEQTTRALNTT